MEMLNEKKRGVKLTIIDTMDYNEFKELCDVISAKGYKIIMVDNGNVVCSKEVQE